MFIFPYLVWFSLCSSLFRELRDKRVVKKMAILPLKPRSMLEFLIYRTWAIILDSLTVETGEIKSGTRDVNPHGWLQGHPLLPQVIIKTSFRIT